MNKVIFMYGLPASGKSTHANELVKRYNKRCRLAVLVSLDSYLAIKSEMNVIESLKNSIDNFTFDKQERVFIIDGLFTTNQELIDAINIVSERVPEKREYSFEVCYWIEDREACLWNDDGRRRLNSRNTIKNHKYEVPNFELLKKETGFNVSFQRKRVVRKPEVKKLADDFNVCYFDSISGTLKSDYWCEGGTSVDCYDEVTILYAQEPVIFTDFDKIVKGYFPEISYDEYQRIRNACVVKTIGENRDYYGGVELIACYECDLKKLLEMIKEKQ